jgi:hypothetical protein
MGENELENFKKSFATKSKTTQGVYISSYKKLRDLLDDVDIASVSQSRVIEVVEQLDNRNSQQALINIAYLIRKKDELGILELEEFRKKNEILIREKKFKTNASLSTTLPSYTALVDFTNNLLETKKYIQYILNYLLLYYQVRNADLDLHFVLYKKDTKDKTKNYLWFSARTKTVHFIRNVYKTAKIVKSNGEIAGYGQKVIKITDPVFINVMKILAQQLKTDKEPIVFIPNSASLPYWIKKMTYEGLGETLYFKIVVNHFRDDVNMLKQISYNRGTDINTILQSYDVESEPINTN